MSFRWAGGDRKERNSYGNERTGSIFRRMTVGLHCCLVSLFGYGGGTNRWHTL